MPSRASTATTATAALTGVIVVWKRVSAVTASVTPSPRSENAPTTAGRTSPSLASTTVSSTRTVVARGSELTATVHGPAGSGTRPRSTPSTATSTPSVAAVRRKPGRGSAAGSGWGGTVASSSVPGAAARAAAQSSVAVSATGW